MQCVRLFCCSELCEKGAAGHSSLLKALLVKASVQATIADDAHPETLDLQAVRAQVDLDR